MFAFLHVRDSGTGVRDLGCNAVTVLSSNSMKTLTSAQVWRAQIVPLFLNWRGQKESRNVAGTLPSNIATFSKWGDVILCSAA